MYQVILQPADHEHFQSTIVNPVDISLIKKFVSEDEFKNLEKLYPNAKVSTWGIKPASTSRNETYWKRMEEDGVVLFYANKKFFASGIIKYKIHNKDIASKLWGNDEEGKTWEYIYFLDEIKERNISIEHFNEVSGRTAPNVRGIIVLKDDDSKRIIEGFNLTNANRNISGVEESEAIEKNSDSITNDEETVKENETINKTDDSATTNKKEELIIDNSEKESVKIPSVEFSKELNIKSLYFEEEQKQHIIKQIKTALKNGKHIILTGCPGTGKSKLAKEICNNYGVKHIMTTANSDWSTFDTIGGYRQNINSQLTFNNGIFLSCFKNKTNYLPTNKWLIIDELNRADIDKAFGAFFSVLTGDEITLSFQADSGQDIVLKPQVTQDCIVPNDYEYIIPKDWRIIATMNTFDKASLYEMSYAFMRRFAFIPVEVPKSIDKQLIEKYLEIWNISNNEISHTLSMVWRTINKYRKVGPAIIRDIALYVLENEDYTSALILYVLPQFEGLLDDEIEGFISEISQALKNIDKQRLENFMEDFLK